MRAWGGARSLCSALTVSDGLLRRKRARVPCLARPFPPMRRKQGADASSTLGSWGKTMRDAVRNKERGKGAVRLPKILVLSARGQQQALLTVQAAAVAGIREQRAAQQHPPHERLQ